MSEHDFPPEITEKILSRFKNDLSAQGFSPLYPDGTWKSFHDLIDEVSRKMSNRMLSEICAEYEKKMRPRSSYEKYECSMAHHYKPICPSLECACVKKLGLESASGVMTAVQEYKECVACHISERFSISLADAMDIMEKSGINNIIDESPVVGTHYAPEEWEENVICFMKKHHYCS